MRQSWASWIILPLCAGGICRVVLKLRNLPHMQSITAGNSIPWHPGGGGLTAPQERESWGKGFYGRRCSKVVGFWVCTRLGASPVFLHEGWWKLSVILVWGKRFWRSSSCFKQPLGWPKPPLWKMLPGSEGTFLSSFQLNRFPITTPPPCTPCKKGRSQVLAVSHSCPQEWKLPTCQPGPTVQFQVIFEERRAGEIALGSTHRKLTKRLNLLLWGNQRT